MRLTKTLTFFVLASLALAVACASQPTPAGPDGAGGLSAGIGGSAAGGAPSSSGGTSAASVVDDVEDGDTRILAVEGRSGVWYSYSDSGTVTLDPTAAGPASPAMGIAFTAVDTGWSGFGLNLKGEAGKEPYDATTYTGVSFWIRADAALTLTFAVADMITDPEGDLCTECHDHWALSVPVTSEWSRVTVHWKDLARGGWGRPTSDALALGHLLGLAWNIEAPGTVGVFVDDVVLLADGVVSPNVTSTLDVTPGSGGNVNEGQGGLPWVDGGPPTGPSPVEIHGQLSVASGHLVGEDGSPAMLRGHAIAWDNWWPQFHNAGVVSWLRQDWCVDLVRPAMGIEPEGAFLEDPAASEARMRAVVEAAIDSGIYVIIDWHAHDIHQAEAVDFFTRMAADYGEYPNVLYEVFNEPDGEDTWPLVKAYAEAVIAAIRTQDPDNVVIVGTPEWDQRIDLAAADPITSDPNVVYAVHFYAATHGEFLRTRVSDALALGIPIFVSESGGSEADGMGANDYDEWNAWFELLEAEQISWVNWSIADKEGETVSMLKPGTSGDGNWTEADLTPTGIHVRSLLRGLNCP